ncbi:MAG: MFS transporter [Oscillospiraceae bacterium]|nr:MFS transporter [Oscillospiraceae bacterium]
MTTLNDSPGKAKRILYFIVFTLAFAVPNYAQYQFSPLGPQIIERFGLTGVQFNSIFTAPMLPAIFTSLISGMLVDRYGYKPVIGASILLTALGCWGRVFAEGYGLMYCAMILLGFSAGFLSSNSSKILSILFGQERVSVIMGLVLTLSTCGMVLSMSTTTALGISKAFLLAAVLASVVLVFWFVVMPGVRERRESGEQAAPAQSVTLGQALVTALKNRHVWVAALVMFCLNGAMTGMGSSIPTALVAERGFTEAAAGVAGAFLMVGNLLGSLLTPTISLKTGKFRLVLMICGVVSVLGCCFAWRLPDIWLYVGLVLTGYTFGSGMAQILSVAIRLPGIGPLYAGTAGGLIATLELLGGVVLPTYVASAIAGANRGVYFIILGIASVVWIIGVYFMPKELDTKG